MSSLLVLIYCAGGIYAIFASGRWELLNLPLLAWFIVFLICAVLMFGSMFLALGSACTTINDAQSLLQQLLAGLVAAEDDNGASVHGWGSWGGRVCGS